VKLAAKRDAEVEIALQGNRLILRPLADNAMTGGKYSLTGGFWSLTSVVQTPGLPNLTITHSGSSVIVSWPNTGNYTLLQNTTLSGGSWTTNTSFVTANGTNSLTLTPPTGNLFFRLCAP